jgi:(2R)-sulfolactate sulfo-lyase subunit beta
LPLDDLSNAAAEAVAKVIPGTLALPHAFGRLQFGEDLQLTFDTLIGTGVNANVAAVVVIGIEPKWTQRVADGIAKTGKPVAAFSIEGKGDLQVIQEASRVAAMFLQDASGLVRTEAEMGDMIMSSAENQIQLLVLALAQQLHKQLTVGLRQAEPFSLEKLQS